MDVSLEEGQVRRAYDFYSPVYDFLFKKIFEPGRTLNWKQLTMHATDEELNPKAFAKDFQG